MSVDFQMDFHMDVPTDASSNAFRDLLESAGVKQHVPDPTNRSGRTLDLINYRQEDSVLLLLFQSLRNLPSDHYVVLCSVAFAKPAASKSHVDAFKSHQIIFTK